MGKTDFTSIPNKGMLTDLAMLNTSQNVYPYALNATSEELFTGEQGLLQNEASNVLNVEFPKGYKVVGFVRVPEQNRTIYFLRDGDVDGWSQIGEVIDSNYNIETNKDVVVDAYCNGCAEPSGQIKNINKELAYGGYRKIIGSKTCLNFDRNYPIDVEYKLGNCSLNLYFTDELNERRYIYFDYEINGDVNSKLILQEKFKVQSGVSNDACKSPVYSEELDCEKIKVHPTYKRPHIEFLDFINGGNLKAGTYQVMICYSDIYGSPISQYFPATQPASLSDTTLLTDVSYITNKALHFKVSNLKINDIFKYYNIVIAQTINNFTEFIFVGTFNTTINEYVYTGFEKGLKQLAPTEVLFRKPYYRTASGVTKANNYLFYANVQEYKTPNLQPIANKIELEWVTVAIKESDYKKAFNGVNYRGYQRDEVYSFGIVFEYDNGRETPAFHIPGRKKEWYDVLDVDNSNDYYDAGGNCGVVPSCSRGNGVQKRWEVYSTARVTSNPHDYSIDCNTKNYWESGTFGYWESTEKYPNIPEVWGEECGECIRHHRFPDSAITHIHDGFTGMNYHGVENFIYPIGVKVDHNSIKALLYDAVDAHLITEDERKSIVSYRIVRGNRVGNKSIVAKGLLYNMLKYNVINAHGSASITLDNDYYFPNYPYNDLSDDKYLDGATFDKDRVTGEYNRFTFHSPDIHFTNAAIGDILKIEAEEYGKTEGYFTYSDCQAKQRLLSIFIQTMAVGLGISSALTASGGGKNQISTSGDSPFSVISNALDNNTFDIFRGNRLVDSPFNEYFEKKDSLFPDGSDGGVGLPGQETGDDLSSNLQRLILTLNETQKILDGLKAIVPYKNLGVQYNSVGKYNNWWAVPEGNRVRQILTSAYLSPDIQTIDEYSGATHGNNIYKSVYINNWQREDSVYIKLANSIKKGHIADDSKQTMTSQFGGDLKKLNTKFSRDISSYYASIKRNVLNQYGQVNNIQYLETSANSFYLDVDYDVKETKVFGGDTYINRFALKRKLPLFQHTLCNVADGSDIQYTNLSNVATPKYYYDTMEPMAERLFPGLFEGANSITDISAILSSQNIGGTFGKIFDGITQGGAAVSLANGNKHNYDAHNSTVFYQNGVIPLYVYGVPYFLVESDVNVDLRYAENNKDKDFYPRNMDLKNWLQEGLVPISTPNYYLYNTTYSKQNHESIIITNAITNWHDFLCNNINYNRVIYSNQQNNVEGSDKWLTFLANDYYDFPLTLGKLISADGIENEKVLVRLTKATQIFSAYNTIQATGADIQVGNAGLFKSRPQDIATTDLGYAGTQHRAIKHTEFGHFWADSERGNIFNLQTGGGGITELGKDGMHSFFKQNLPFVINKDFPKYKNIDNNLNGVGLHYGFDKRYNRILVTKLDYKCVDKKNVEYDDVLNEFYLKNTDPRKVVTLNNPKYFCNKGWTVSYDLANQCWKSFHSYKPLFYNDNITTFDSSISKIVGEHGVIYDKQYLYTHNITNKSYQIFYGKLEPFVVEVTSKQSLNNNVISSVEYYSEAIRYHNEYDKYYAPNITFNKAIISSINSTSGLLNLHVSNPNDFTETLNYPKRVIDGREILINNSEGVWRFNDFFDVARNTLNNIPLYTYDCGNTIKQLNQKALDYDKSDFDSSVIRGRMCNIRFVQDKVSNYKLIFAFTTVQQTQSFR